MPLIRQRALLRNARSLATSAAVKPTPISTPPRTSSISSELSNLKSSLFHLLGSSHPSLDAVAKYYFQAEGKHLRPQIVLLMSRATNGLGGAGWAHARERERLAGGGGVDESLTSVEGVLNDWNPEQGSGDGEVFAEPYRVGSRSRIATLQRTSTTTTTTEEQEAFGDILSTQRRLASITEMIHVASLLHDDVIDASPLRRGAPSAPQQFSNKLSILAGDFLLGRASVALARLGNQEVVELLATVLANLVEGEVMQMRSSAASDGERVQTEPSKEAFEVYMRKTYLKTASLMAKSARASVILGGCGVEGTREELQRGERVKDVAYAYGRNLGIAFQLIDDLLDFLPPSPTLGKPSLGADLSLGLTTAPVLYAWRTNPALGPLIARKYAREGDVAFVRELVGKSDGLARTRELAEGFAREARRAVEEGLPESEAREELIGLTRKVTDRVA
ncbi:coq1 putative hexaprenyl diphosphate synthase [Naganishia albida]|nr:coq1 putative hexaprenyl diphosphate synthase [Naganishia albida]